MRYLVSTMVITTLMTAMAMADALGGKIGVNYWNQQYDASAAFGTENIDLDATFDIDEESDYQLYAVFEHPIPLLPNLMVQHTRSNTSGDGVVETVFFDRFEKDGEVHGELDLTHTDATVYWELLDNQFSLDLGMSVRVFDGGVNLTSLQGETAELILDDIVPLLYASTRFDLPFTGWHVKADGNFITYDGDKVLDAKAAIGWEMGIGLGAELGYRYMDIDYKVKGGQLDALDKGIYLGLFWDF